MKRSSFTLSNDGIGFHLTMECQPSVKLHVTIRTRFLFKNLGQFSRFSSDELGPKIDTGMPGIDLFRQMGKTRVKSGNHMRYITKPLTNESRKNVLS